MKSVSVLSLLIILSLALAKASPIDDLASPQQSVRDRAAAELRASFQGTPDSKWMATIQKIEKGQTKKEILELLRPFNVTEGGGVGSGQSHSQSYRLDDEWLLTCSFQNDGDILIDRKLNPSLRNVWIAPPKSFTGVWIVYFVNGQRSHTINYREGQYFGEFTVYHSDGSKLYVQHCTEEGANGEATGYYPSGSVSYRAQYKAGKPVGLWTWYDENGKVSSTEKHDEP